ncbi:hypothetical protein EV361DRAFT_391326 [Lentinula raphanica]|uniref:Uncharacterized protein n=1 Tax=Lentinula raphanica TaxID=153919 RepID=A0AA38UF66_9AGAR|nr:hypothetical protein F5880DRAFT_909672 [Lentinula raphanica]KAJ3838860.1 hypothetical protein F5878DRAFT_618327 [Lentinula raphanica]KAJ3968793.1 hypothetical protein EV361DRAFT_391326 [Lentinula raphanica]
MAGVHAQMLSIVAQSSGKAQFPVVSALFTIGLLASMFGALLCFVSARWFETLAEDEVAYHSYCWKNRLRKHGKESILPTHLEHGLHHDQIPHDPHLRVREFMEYWTTISITAGPFFVLLQVALLLAGMVLYIFETQSTATKVIVSTFKDYA